MKFWRLAVARRNLAWFATMAVVYALSSWLFLAMAQSTDGVAAVWTANAVLAFALMNCATRRVPNLALGGLAGSISVNLLAGFPLVQALANSFANLFEALAACWLLKRYCLPFGDLFGPRNLPRFCAIAITVCCASAVLSTAAIPGTPLREWQSWFLSDLLGMALTIPSLFVLRDTLFKRRPESATPLRLLRRMAVYGLVLVAALATFYQPHPDWMFVLALPVLLAVVEAGRIGAVIAMSITAIVAVLGGQLEAGSFATGGLGNQMLLLQAFLACQLLISLPIASLMEEREVAAAIGMAQERTLRNLSEKARRTAERSNRIMALTAARDSLTGLKSRARIMQKLEAGLGKARAGNEPLSIALFDIDHFKRVNDRFGHYAGDEVLCIVAELAESLLPRCYALGRIGGEEFMVVMPGSGRTEAVRIAELLRKEIMHGTLADGPCAVTVSIGLAHAEAEDSVKSLLISADLALYDAKAAGRNQLRAAA